MCQANKYKHLHNETVRQCNPGNISYVVFIMAPKQIYNNIHHASTNRASAQADCACRIPEDVLEYWYIYIFPAVFLIKFESIFPEKSSFEIARQVYLNSFVISRLIYL